MQFTNNVPDVQSAAGLIKRSAQAGGKRCFRHLQAVPFKAD